MNGAGEGFRLRPGKSWVAMDTEAGNLLVTLACAELFLVLVRYREINIIAKKRSQRTPAEQRETGRGLGRALLLELLVFVPASVMLMWIAVRPWFVKISIVRWASAGSAVLADAWLGIISYAFPFATVRRVITRVALNTLDEFAATQSKPGNLQSTETPLAHTDKQGRMTGA